MAPDSTHYPSQSLQSASVTLLSWAQAQYRQHISKQPSSSASETASRLQLAVQPPLSNALVWLRHHPYHQKLYFCSRDKQTEIAAIGFLHIATGSVFDQAAHLSLIATLDPNHSYQRFYGAIRFDDSSQARRDPEWEPFNGFTFVLPAVELVRDVAGQFFLAANFYHSSSLEILSQVLSTMLPLPSSVYNVDPVALIPRARHIYDPTAFPTWDSSMKDILHHLSCARYEKIVLARRKRFQFNHRATPTPMHILSALEEQNKRSVSDFSLRQSAKEAPNADMPQPHIEKACSQCVASSKGCQYVESNKGSYLFCLQLDKETAFLGCPPERLFRLEDGVVFTEALAGTVRRGTEGNERDELSELLNSKNLEEHHFVVEYIRNALQSSGAFPLKTSGPHVRRLPRLMHLSTDIQGRIPSCSPVRRPTKGESTEGASISTIYNLLRALHPTAAVCGVPKDHTIAELRRLEDFDRGLFAGPVGWISRDGGEFCVAIRSALIHGNSVTAFAGCGIVPGSESKSEWEETELKLSAFTDLLHGRVTETLTEDVSCSLRNSNAPSSGYTVNQQNGSSANEILRVVNCKRNAQDPYASLPCRNLTDNSNGCHVFEQEEVDRSKTSRPPNLSRFSSHHSRALFDASQLENEPNLNSLWGCCVVEELCRNGVRTFFVSPGSRSAPLAVGVSRSQQAELYVAHDERGAGFLAVGYARGTGRAAAVITSSGTAVANLMPAAVEASMDNLPLIFLTADRPPELRDVGANQAIHQPDIFGKYARWSKDIPCPCEGVPLRNLLSDIDHAVYMSGSGKTEESVLEQLMEGGSVHLNMMFRESLAPDEEVWNRKYVSHIGERWRQTLEPMTNYFSVIHGVNRFSRSACDGLSVILSDLMKKKAGVIIVGGHGRASVDDELMAVVEIARFFGWPIIPDVCSGLRFESFEAEVIHFVDQIFGSTQASDRLVPDAVLQFGERITSKRVSKMIQKAAHTCKEDDEFMHVLISASSKRHDSLFTVTHRIRCPVWDVLASLPSEGNGILVSSEHQNSKSNVHVDYRGSKLMVLSKLSRQVNFILNDAVFKEKDLTEPQCARVISECLQRPSALFLGNSMPIRDFDAFVQPTVQNVTLKVAANRGASGIDGILSSGIGFGIGLRLDVTIVIGDMSMIHDLNALHLLRADESTLPVKVTIVVVNNGGGGIFSFLPIAKHQQVFSPVFDTPHNVNFRHACDMFRLQYHEVRTANDLRKAIGSKNGSGGHRLIEAVISQDHASNVALHQELRTQVSQGLNCFFHG